ncbi:MAG: hypothetical protein H6531_01355 [Actinobacteria bacterium]|nr:hypothetical protein [Actinomycetota bacterium]
MKKRLFGIGGAALLVILVIVGIVIYQSLDDQTEASASAELEAFRAAAGAARDPEPGLPLQGVYTYSVKGNEAISRGVTVKRDFPATATMVVLHDGDGYSTDIKYSEQHLEMVRYVLEDEGTFLTFAKTTVSAGPITSVRDRTWTPRLLRFPAAGASQKSWGGTYKAGALDLQVKASEKPSESVTVGDATVQANVYEFVQDVTGEYSGDRTEVFWVDPKTSLVVRYTIESRLRGPVNIDFFADQTLDSLTPQT